MLPSTWSVPAGEDASVRSHGRYTWTGNDPRPQEMAGPRSSAGIGARRQEVNVGRAPYTVSSATVARSIE